MNSKVTVTLVVFICAVIVQSYIYFSSRNRDKIEIERAMSEYLRVEKSTDINAYVKIIYIPNRIRWDGIVTFVVLDNSKKISIFSKLDVRNQIRINEIISPGIHLRKRYGSDTLIISNKIENDMKREFILNN